METEFTENMIKEAEAARPLVLTSRKFRRNANLGMKVWRSESRNFDYGTEVEHVEIACPSYELTERGPMIERKEEG